MDPSPRRPDIRQPFPSSLAMMTRMFVSSRELFDNEVNLCNFGRGGGNVKP